MNDRRQLILNVYVRSSGYHEAAWRLNDDDPAVILDPRHYIRLARTAERGILDMIFLPDSPGTASFRTEFIPGGWLDPVELLSSLATTTEHIGLAATVSTTYSQPWDVARRLATLDFLSHGRAAWNIVTTAEPAAAYNFGSQPHPDTATRYRRAEEYVEVALKLWDAWEDDAAIMDKTTGSWADPTKVHRPDHHGTHFAVAGDLAIPRSPQGRPVLLQAGSSPGGVSLAGRFADAVFTPQPAKGAAAELRRRLSREAVTNGRPADAIKILPGMPFVLGSTEAEARGLRRDLEEWTSTEFRWRNVANLAGLDYRTIEPGQPLPDELIDAGPRTSFGAAILERARAERDRGTKISFADLSREFSALPGGLDFTGTPEQLADLIGDWFTSGACDGFTLMPHMLPGQLDAFVDEVVPLLQRKRIAKSSYHGTTLRDHLGLARPAPYEQQRGDSRDQL